MIDHLPNRSTAFQAEYIFQPDTLGSASFIAKRNTLSAATLAFLINSLSSSIKPFFHLYCLIDLYNRSCTIAALATSNGAITFHSNLGVDAKSVINPVGTVIVSVLFVSLTTATPTSFNALTSFA